MAGIGLALLVAGCATAPEYAPVAIPEQSDAPLTETRKSVIIYPDRFERAARAFAFLHREFGGTEALLTPLSKIKAAGLPTDSLVVPFDGWQNLRGRQSQIRNYDFALARQIIAYLRDLQQKEPILAVLILGDGGLVPPSYYFYVPYLQLVKVPDIAYNEWIASDLLYASPDLDLAHEWGVGRISVDTPGQALHVAGKYYRWALRNRQNEEQRLVFFAGNILNDTVYGGELLYLLMQKNGLVNNRTRHYLQSDGRFTIDHLKKSMAEDAATLHFFFTHGFGDGIAVNGQYLYSHQIARLPYKEGLPLFISPSCMDGGFDYDLIDAPHDRDGYSVGEAILRAPGAGIGYLGSSRVSLGQFYYQMQDGVIHPQQAYYRYMPGLLMDFLAAYHDGARRIGDAYVEAHRRYQKRFAISDPLDLATFVELNLLADPVLLLPAAPSRSENPAFDHLYLKTGHLLHHEMPVVAVGKPLDYVLDELSPYPEAEAIVINALSGAKVWQEQVTRQRGLLFVPSAPGAYLIRLEFADGQVSWQYFRSM